MESVQFQDPSLLHKKLQAQERPLAAEVEQGQVLKAQVQEVEALRALNETPNLQEKLRDPTHPKTLKVQGVPRVLVVPSHLANPNPLQPLNHQKNQNNKRMNQKEKERRKMSVLLRTRTRTNTLVLKKRRKKRFLV